VQEILLLRRQKLATIFVVHDALGRILSITPGTARGVGFFPQAGHSVLELDIRVEFEKVILVDIHKHHCADLNARRLVTRSSC